MTIGTQPKLLQIALDTKDVVYTPDWVARDMVEYFKPTGSILEPCAGDGAFLKYLPGADWCEIEKGRDFFQWHKMVDWCIGNPPYGLFSEWLEHSFDIADNIAYLIPLYKVFYDYGRLKNIHQYGGVKSIYIFGRGEVANFTFGQACAGVHFQKNYHGGMKISYYEDL